MNALLILTSLVCGGTVAWWGTWTYDKLQKRQAIEGLEAKLRLERGQTAEMREKMAQIRGEMVALERTLNQERIETSSKIMAIGTSFKRGVFVFSSLYFVFGLGLGGVGAWWTATSRAEAKHMSETASYVISARTAEEKVNFLEKQIEKLEKEMHATRLGAYEEIAARQALETKLAILVDSLSPSRGVDGFTLDYQKMKTHLSQQAEEPEIGPNLPGIPFKNV